jgi:D-aminoacyl-tRNA deacylase
VWADVILSLLKDELKGAPAPEEPPQVPVVVTFGGGHYAPRANQMGALEHAILGHMLANHSLPFKRDEDGTVLGSWARAVDVALDASRAAHPAREVVVSLDRKSFRGWERRALFDHLEARNIPVIDTATHRTMLDGS